MSFKHLIFVPLLIRIVRCEMEATMSNIPEDGRLDFMALTKKYGHISVAHEIINEDGYILQIFNTPGHKGTIVMMHGVFDSANGFVIRGNTSLGIILANEGYDVWYINMRGNRYSRKHTKLDPDKDKEFWDFSLHEYGKDLGACIDYILNKTGNEQVSIIGFSEGTTATFILGSINPEYNKKIKVFIAMAPVVYLENVRSTISVIIQISPVIDFFLPASFQEFVGYNSLMKAIINIMCTQLPIGYELCYYGGMNSVSGMDRDGIEKSFFNIVIGAFPAGSSRKNLIHYSQIGLRKKFAQYDYGVSKNFQMYGTFTPPEYDVTKVTMDVVLVCSENDPVATLTDVEVLRQKLPNVVDYIVINRDTYNHLDHLWANDAHILEYPIILKTLAKYN